MLTITIPAKEGWDESKQEFVYLKEQQLRLEHSLVSLSKWERKWHKAYFSTKEKTNAETIDYIKCMTLTQNVNPDVYDRLSKDNINEIYKYIQDPMTSIQFPDEENSKGKIGGDTITYELIYYWMITLGIPVKFEKWNLNCLLNLIRVCNIKNAPNKKMNKSEIMRRNRALNEARRKQFNSKG